SERAGVEAAVDQEVLAGDVARLGAADEGAQLAKLLGRAEPPGRNLRERFGLDLRDRTARSLRRERHAGAQPIGVEASGQDVVDRDVVLDRLAGDPGDEPGQAGAGAVRQPE